MRSGHAGACALRGTRSRRECPFRNKRPIGPGERGAQSHGKRFVEELSMKRALLSEVSWAALVGVLAFGCGRGATTHRNVDTVVGTTDAFGAPRNTRYSAYAESEREVIRITVFEQSECDQFKMKIVQRVDETVRNGEVIGREPAKQVQVAEGTFGVVPCAERWARNAWVALRVGGQTFRLGAPTERGEVIANLSGELKQSLYAEPPSSQAVIMVNGIEAGAVSLAGLNLHEKRVNDLIEQMNAILAKDENTLTKDDITRSYQLYDQLGQIDTGGDARVSGIRTRFIELLYQRKMRDATEHMKRNIAALNEAKGIVPLVAAGQVPDAVLTAVKGGELSPEAIWWARGEAASALHRYPALCGPTPFGWGRVASGDYAAASRLAFSYLRGAYSDPFLAEVHRLCGRLAR
jgi:hypothetical protein